VIWPLEIPLKQTIMANMIMGAVIYVHSQRVANDAHQLNQDRGDHEICRRTSLLKAN
jgi:hypothetical protein